jgi:triacylglycerol lipase
MIPKKQKRPTDEAAGCAAPGEDLSSCPVLLVPGWGAPHWHTRWIARKLEQTGLTLEEMRLPYMAVGDMRRSAAMVKDEVDRIRERTGSDRVSMVGYSLGGLIERIYLQEHGGYQHLGRAVFVGSPQDGIYTAYAGVFTKAGRQVSKGSKFMRNLNSSHACGCEEQRCLAIFLSVDGTIFPSRSARLRCGYNLELVWPVLHWGLVFNPQVARAAAEFLKGELPDGAVPGVKESRRAR